MQRIQIQQKFVYQLSLVTLLTQNSCQPLYIQLQKQRLSMPVSNAWPERGASTLKRIKTQGSLENRILNSLMHISVNGPDLHTPEANHLLKIAVNKQQTTKKNEKGSNRVYREQCQKAVMWVARQTFKTDKFCNQQLEHPLKTNHWRSWNWSTHQSGR